jgi:hypothetical protein
MVNSTVRAVSFHEREHVGENDVDHGRQSLKNAAENKKSISAYVHGVANKSGHGLDVQVSNQA